jgi:hypothetical protein
LPTARNVRVATENIAQKTSRTTSGPTAGVAMARPIEAVLRFIDPTAFCAIGYLFAGYNLNEHRSAMSCLILLRRQAVLAFNPSNLRRQIWYL